MILIGCKRYLILMLQHSELLDRMEILYPNESRFTDLRRAYIDRDLSSLFRLFVNDYGDDADELRKAVMESNLHSIFRIFEDGLDLEHRDSQVDLDLTDLRKFILEDNVWSLFRVLLDVVDTRIVSAIKSFHSDSTFWDKDALSQGQLRSKMWLINELKTLDVELGTVFLCAGWYGILATLLFEHDFDINVIRSFDMDPAVAPIAEKFNLPWFIDHWRFKALTDDIHNINFEEHTWTSWSNEHGRESLPITESPDTIINTSCEHIARFDEWYAKIPTGKLLILQSNDYSDIVEHVNLSPTLDDFAIQTPMTSVLFSGKLDLISYNRFMRIGIR